MKNTIKNIDAATFLILIIIIVSGFLTPDRILISNYEKLAGHSINNFSVEIIILFKNIILCILTLAMIIALGSKYNANKKNKIKTIDKKNIFMSLLFPILILLLIQSFFIKPFIDDAFISFRYAKNLFEKGQLAFNMNEPPVEGYTHPLWVFLLLIPQFLEINTFLFIKIIGLLFSLATLILVYFISGKNPVATGLYALSPSVAGWTMTGLETPMYVALSLLFIHLFLKEKYISCSFLLFLVTLTRPEGLVLLFPAIFILIQHHKLRMKNLVKFITPFFTAYFIYNIWKYIYFGDLLPNTFYVKSHFLVGVPYIIDFIFFTAPLTLSVLFYALYARFKMPQNFSEKFLIKGKKDMFILLCFIFTLFSYFNLQQVTGFYYRFFQLPLVLLYIFSSTSIYAIIIKLRAFANKKNIQLLSTCLIVLFFASNSYDLPKAIVYFNIHYDGLEKAHISLAKWLSQQYPENYTAALSDIGAFSYYSDFEIIDMYGLTDKVLSRGFNATYLLERNPEIIILDSSSTSKFIQTADLYSANKQDLLLYNDMRFQKKYVFLNKTFEHTPPIVLWPFKRIDISEHNSTRS